MSKPAYRTDDVVVLKGGMFRKADNDRTCRIKTVLPEAYGAIQYRVQFADENFERRVNQDDIEKPAVRVADKVAQPSAASGSRWVNLSAIKIKR